MLYRVNEIISYAVTRDLVLRSELTDKEYVVFDDSDVLGKKQFSFLKIGDTYQCKIGIFGEVDSNGSEFEVLNKEKIANMKLVRVKNNSGDIFYIPDSPENVMQSSVKINIRRYDLLAVGEIINDRSLEGIQSSY